MKKVPGRTHLVLPDCQVKHGVSTDYLGWIGQYIVDRRPDVIVCLGDFADMASLSSYDRGKRSFEGRRYKLDIQAAREGMTKLLAPLKALNHKRAKAAQYTPAMYLTYGNHEERILRAIEDDARLEGTIGLADLGYEEFGWRTYDFLQPVCVDGISYCHFFPRAASGSISQTKRGAPNARAQLIREGGSCTAGHQQGLDVACLPLRGRLQWGLIAGSAYEHSESYLSPQGNSHWRGIIVKHQVDQGSYDPMFVSLDYLKKRYKS